MRKSTFFYLFSIFTWLINHSLVAQDYQWAKRIGGTGSASNGSVVTDNIGNLCFIGRFQGIVDFDPGPGTYSLSSVSSADMFISKLDSAGNFMWAKSLVATVGTSISSIIVDKFDNLCISGSFIGTIDFDPGSGVFNLNAPSGYRAFIAKYDSFGNFLVAKAPTNYIYAAVLGGAITTDFSGNFYTTGTFQGTVDFNSGSGLTATLTAQSYDAYICKFDNSCNLIWAKNIGGPNSESGSSLAVDASGNVYTVGNYSGIGDYDPGPGVYNLTYAGGNYDVFISKLDSMGNFVWAKRIAGPNDEYCNLVRLDKFANIHVAGSFMGSTDFDPGIATMSLTSAGMSDAFIVKLNKDGNFIWAKSFGGADFDEGGGMDLDSYGNLFATGSFSGTSDFDPSLAASNLTSTGNIDSYVFKLDSSGGFISAKSLSGKSALNSQCFGQTVEIDNWNRVNVSGVFRDTVDFDPGTGVADLFGTGGYNIFLLRLGRCNVQLHSNNLTPICSGESVTLTANGSSSYSFFPGYNAQNSASVVVSPLSSTLYTVYGTSTPTCVSIGNLLVTVDACTSIKNNNLEKDIFTIYPNPNNGDFTVKSPYNLQLKLFDELGQFVRVIAINEKNNFTVDVRLPDGFYFLVSERGNQKIIVRR